ncbi:MAG: PEGA domain-containing protein [Sedimentisphaerales bacterium]|nr:PEGA domain-containing protein [Sedimentisphaerales bacterium]
MNLYSQPSGATVQVGSKVHGETPCKIQIPKDSVLIKNHFVDITYTLPDGRRITKNYDLRNYEPPGEFPAAIGGMIMLPGILLWSLTETSEDDQYSPFDKEDDTENDRELRLIALGLIGLGFLVFSLFDDARGAEGYDILETFEDVNETSINGQ